MIPTTINERWTLFLPEHRHARLEWPVWEKERLAAMHDLITGADQIVCWTCEDTWKRDDPDRCLDASHRQNVLAEVHETYIDQHERDVVYDIGAEEGDFPALWATWGADVVLVEPNPRVWPNIRAIFEANGLVDHVKGWHVGFAGKDVRTADWSHDPARGENPDEDVDGWPRCAYGPVIGDHGFLVLPERPDVPVTTIDNLAARYGAPTVITIDVEGAELTVLRGAKAVLSVNRPAVFVSVHIDLPWIDEKYPGDTGDKVAEFMTAYGYVGRHLATDHEEHWEWRHPEGR